MYIYIYTYVYIHIFRAQHILDMAVTADDDDSD